MTITVLESFHRAKGYKLANLDPTGLERMLHFLGFSGLRKVWAIGVDSGGDSALMRFDEHGTLELKVVHAGARYITGAIDDNGYIWVSDSVVPEVHRCDPSTGAILDTLVLSDGADDHAGLGALFVKGDAIEDARMWFIGKNVNNDDYRLFRVHASTVTQEAFGANLASAGAIFDRISMILDPDERRLFGADRNASNSLMRFDRATLSGTFIAVPARDNPIWGLHYAFGSFWMGAFNTAAAPSAQLTRTDRNGNLEVTITPDDSMVISGFAHDDTHLYAALTAELAGVSAGGTDNRNRVAKIDPTTNTIVATYPYGGTTQAVQDGLGDRILDLLTIDEPPRLPLTFLTDAAVWWRGDDPDAEYTGFGAGTHLISLPNRGPQSPFGNVITGGASVTRPELTDLNGLQGVEFPAAATRDLASSLPASTTAWNLLHDGTGMTLAFVIHPTDAATADQDVLNTLTASVNTNTGIRVTYDGATERLRVQIGNSGGVDFVVNEVTADLLIPANASTIVTIVYDENAVGDKFTIRTVLEAPSEPKVVVSSVGTGEAPDVGIATGVLTVASQSVFFKGWVPECVLIRGTLEEFQQRRLEKYLSRWQP